MTKNKHIDFLADKGWIDKNEPLWWDINNIKKSDEKKLLDYAKGKEMNIEDGLTKELLAKIKKKKLKVAKKNITFIKFEPLKQLAAKGKMRNVIAPYLIK